MMPRKKGAQAFKRAQVFPLAEGRPVYDPRSLKPEVEIRVHDADALVSTDYVVTAGPHYAPQSSPESGVVISVRRIEHKLLRGRKLGPEETLSLVDIGVLPYPRTAQFSHKRTIIISRP